MMLYQVDGVDLFQRAGEDALALLPARLAEARLPFDPLGPGMLHRSPEGEPVLIWMFACRELTPTGRCGIYGARPAICRTYEPASDALCVHYGGSEAGDASGCGTFALASTAI
jgi:Fe-S-cluster containining protein